MNKLTITTKAYVLSDGEVVSQSYLEKYALKTESKQIAGDKFKGDYSKDGIIQPLYSLEALAQLMEMNTYHMRAVKTKARDVAGLGWDLIPKENVENPSQEQKQKAINFFENCNPRVTIGEIFAMVMIDHEAIGNGYFEIIRDEKGEEIIGIEHIPAHTMRSHKDMIRYVQKRGNQKAWFKRFGFEKDVHVETGEIFEKGTLDIKVRANEVIHLKNYTPRSDYYGIPDIVSALPAILGDKEIKEYNISFFENHAIPAYAVTVTGADLDEKTEQQIKRFFQKEVKKSNHSTLVLTAKFPDDSYGDNRPPIKFEFHKLNTEIKEASFRMFRQDNRDEILSAHGVPPYRAGITVEGQLGGSTAAESTEIYKQSVVKQKQEMLESRINRFILQEGLGITDWKFKFREIDTRDEDRLVQRLKTIFDIGALTSNEVREKLGYERIDNPNMDRYFIYGRPLEPSFEETQAIVDSLKSLHSELIQIVKKNIVDRQIDSIRDFESRQKQEGSN